MIVFTLIFGGLAVFEWNFLQYNRRKKRTIRIVYFWLGVAYMYVMAVYAMKNFPSPNRLIMWIFGS
ncbi:hypothetical protein [Paenibacillus hamazuiensis]|uniref:hypothetical protein n=1 Tax=Paenibacillus hamazuiensis TaxID=2936508 RepID=UPI00200F027D|nr:hypothetical protein [Paenibacillus hamazuiensis]